jgi:peptidoglycan/xylan/chitin deacetylase (PgdA/CDA1 family)
VQVPDEAATVCLTFDFDAISVWTGTFGLTSASAVSRGEFGARVAVPRILEVLERERVHATFFTPGVTIDTWPEVCRRIIDEGHEIAHHGYSHATPATLDEGAERQELEKGLEAMDRHLGGHRAVGYRAPASDLSSRSTGLLHEYGFAYDSSMMAQDFEPYWCRSGDVVDAEGSIQFGEEIELVEIPFSWSLDDFPQMEFVAAPGRILEGLNDPEKCLRMWTADFEYMADEVPGGVYCMCFHPQVIGRGARMRVLEQMITSVKGRGARLRTCADAAKAWAERNPLAGGRGATPDPSTPPLPQE